MFENDVKTPGQVLGLSISLVASSATNEEDLERLEMVRENGELPPERREGLGLKKLSNNTAALRLDDVLTGSEVR
jgi:hypothetical protein